MPASLPYSAQMLEMYKEFCTKYPVISIEDPFEQDDWEPSKSLTAENICQVLLGVVVVVWLNSV